MADPEVDHGAECSAEGLSDKLRDFAPTLDPVQRCLFAAPLAPGLDAAWSDAAWSDDAGGLLVSCGAVARPAPRRPRLRRGRRP